MPVIWMSFSIHSDCHPGSIGLHRLDASRGVTNGVVPNWISWLWTNGLVQHRLV